MYSAKELLIRLIGKRLPVLLAVALWPGASVTAQTAAPGWKLRVHATNVSTVSGGEALAADLSTADLFVRSLESPAGFNVQLARVLPTGSITILATFPNKRNSGASGILIDPLTGGIIVADEVANRIALVTFSNGVNCQTIFNLPWVLNPAQNGTGQQQYALDPANPNLLYFWDSTTSGLYRLDRSTRTLPLLLALDQGTPPGRHQSTYANDLLYDPATRRLLLTDGSSNCVLEIDPTTTPAAVTNLVCGFPTSPIAVALNPLTNEIFIQRGNSIFVSPRDGSSWSPVVSDFAFLTDRVVGRASDGDGFSLYAVDILRNTVYEITPGPCSVTPRTLDFRTFCVGTSADQIFTVSNRGNATLIITGLTTSNPAFSVVTPLPVDVPPDYSALVTVRFTCTSPGQQEGTLSLYTDPACGPSNLGVVSVSGCCAQPSCDLSGPDTDFGNLGIGQTRDRTFFLTNNGNVPLSIGSMFLTNSAFTIVSPTTFPVTVPVGGSVMVTIRFTCETAGSQVGRIDTESLCGPVYCAPVRGTCGSGVGTLTPSAVGVKSDSVGQRVPPTFPNLTGEHSHDEK